MHTFIPSATKAVACLACAVFCVAGNGYAQEMVLDGVSPFMGAIDPLWADAPKPQYPIPQRGDAACQTPGPSQALNLAQAMVLALCNSPDLRQADVDIARQAAGVGQARAAYLPTVSVGVTRNKDNTATTYGTETEHSEEHSSGETVTVNYRLLDSGARAKYVNSAKSQLAGALANNDAVLQKVVTRAAQAYTDAAAAQSAYMADKQAQDSAQELTKITQARQERGLTSGFDTLQAQVAQAKAALSTSRSKAAFEAAFHLLRYLTGLEGVGDLRLVPVQEERAHSQSMLATFAQKREQMLLEHPTLKSLRYQLKGAQEQVRATVAEGFPSLDWSASRFVNGRPGQSISPQNTVETLVSVTLNIPLFEGFGRTYKVKAAQSALVGKAAELTDAEQRLVSEAQRLRDELSTALDSLDAGQQWVQFSEKNVSSAQLRYQRGLSDVTEVINAYTELNKAQKERIQAQSDWSKAYVGLLGQFATLDLRALSWGEVASCSELDARCTR